MLIKALPLVFVASASAAACPIEGDLERGIYLVQDDESTTHFIGDGTTVVETVRYSDGDGDHRFSTRYGVFFEDQVDLLNDKPIRGSGQSAEYSQALPDLDELVSGFTWESRLVTSYSDGYPPERAVFKIEVGAERQVSLAGCDYLVLPIEHRWDIDDGAWYVTKTNYIPTLGMAVLVEDTGSDGFYQRYRTLSFSSKALVHD